MDLRLTRLRQFVTDIVSTAQPVAPPAGGVYPGIFPVTWPERAVRFAQEPVTLLLTGRSGSGKSTIARALERRLFDTGRAVAVLDDDSPWPASDAGTRRPRPNGAAFRRSIAAARLLNDAGLIAICACAAPTIDIRRRARVALEPSRLLEIYLAAPPERCRDLTGEVVPFEAPPRPDLTLPAHLWRVTSSVDAILKHLHKHRVLR